MYKVDTANPALVTGATGYVAGWIIKELLEAGVSVHAAVRDPSKKEKLAHLDAIAEKSPGKIQYFKTDLLEERSYSQAIKGCSFVFHVASPFITTRIQDPQKELIDPAKLGTQNVLEQATQTQSVRRVVLTSSIFAILGDNIELKDTPNGVFTEEFWNTSSSADHNPYSFSKTIAEKSAWTIAETQSQWDMIAINPSFVMGPGLATNSASGSFSFIRDIGNGRMKLGLPNWEIGVVDVRDLAKAHVAAAYTPKAKGRYIVSGHDSSLLEMAQQLLPKYGDQYPIPRKKVSKLMVWLTAPIFDTTRKFIARNVGFPLRLDNSKSIRDLKVSYRPLSETMNDFFQQIIDAGQI